MSSIFITPFSRPLGIDGRPLGLGQLLFYYTGTLNEAPVYDDDGDVMTQPVLADITGVFPNVFLDDSITYRARLLNAAGVEQGDVDPIISLKQRETFSVKDSGATGDGTTDDTAAIQAALTAHTSIEFPDGIYKITDVLTVASGQKITLGPGVTIRQYTANTPIFTATSQDNLTFLCNGAILYGEGAWSSGWTGNGGHLDTAFRLRGCDNVLIDKPHIQNCAHAGISLLGGSTRVVSPIIEGTNAYSTAVPLDANFQNGIYIKHDTTYGGVDLSVESPDISGTAMGIAEEIDTGVTAGPLRVNGGYFHDIPGQHCFYLQSPDATIIGTSLETIGRGGIKVQATSATNLALTRYVFQGIRAKALGGNMFEIAHITGTGNVSDLLISGQGEDVVTGLAIAGDVSRLNANLVLNDVTSAMTTGTPAAVSARPGFRDSDVTISCTNMSEQGIIVDSDSFTDIRLRPTLHNPNTSAAVGDQYGIILSKAGTLDLFDPEVTDAGTHMSHALGTTISAAKIIIHGRAKFSGYATADIKRVAGSVIEGTYPVSYTSTITSSAGAITASTASATYTVENDIVRVNAIITITTAGAGAGGNTFFTGPYDAAVAAAFSGVETAASGRALAVRYLDGDLTKIQIQTYDANGICADGDVFHITGTYRRVAS